MGYSNPTGPSMPGYGMDVAHGQSNTKEQLSIMLSRKGKMGGSITEQYEPPPPQYSSTSQYGSRIANQGYSAQPPGYGQAPPPPTQGKRTWLATEVRFRDHAFSRLSFVKTSLMLCD